MKKLIFILTLVLVASVRFSVAQIPNPGFESWTNMGAYNTPDGWGTTNNLTAPINVYTATKGTPGSPGTAYLKLTSRTAGTVVANGIAVSGQLDTVSMQPISGFPCSSRPANLTGKWQHMIYGSSQGSISVRFTRWDAALGQQTSVGSGSVTLSGMAMSWANFSIPINYVNGDDPDTCIIILKASGSAPNNNDYLWVDNLAFSGTVLGVNEASRPALDFTLFPNPATERISVNYFASQPSKASFKIMDQSGRECYNNTALLVVGKNNFDVDLSGWAKGSYLFMMEDKTGRSVRSFLVR